MTPTPENATLELGEVNMGHPDTLKDFANWTINYYPANYYFLVLWDHGTGCMGVCFDATSANDALSLSELGQALSGLPVIIDVVLIDACSMNMIEVAYQIKDYANVLVGPEGLGYGPPPYDQYLLDLTSNSLMPPNAFASEVVTDYMDWCIPIAQVKNATMSATDLTKSASLMAAIDDFVLKLKEKETFYHEQINLARNLTEEHEGPYAGDTGYYIDLYHFAQLIYQYASDEELRNVAYQVMTVLSIGNVIIKEAHKVLQHSHGLSIFFPNEKKKYYDSYGSMYEKTSFAIDTGWDRFVKYYLSGCFLTIDTPYYHLSIKVDEESYTADNDGNLKMFVLLGLHAISVPTPVSTEPSGSRGVFTQWKDGSKSNPRTILMTGKLTLEATYETQYCLTASTDPADLTPQPNVSPPGPWYADGTRVTCTAQEITGYVFDHWTVDGTSLNLHVKNITVVMNEPHETTAYYVHVPAWWEMLFRPEMLQIILGLVGGVTVAFVGAVWVRNRRRKVAMKIGAEPVEIEVSKVVLPNRITSGYADLDNILFGGIPQNYAVILTSPTCDERDLLIKRFLEAGTKKGEFTFYVTTNPREVKSLAEEFQSNFYLFVCNPQADTMIKSLPNVFKLKGVENLTEIIIALTKAFRTLDISQNVPRRACIDIISDVLLQHHAVQTRRWLTDLIPDLKSKGFTTLAVMNPQMHSPQEVQAILDLFEGEINIYEKETEKGPRKYLIVKKMTDQKYSENELPLRKERIEQTKV